VKPPPLDPSIARHVASLVANLQQNGPAHGAGMMAWGRNRGMTDREVRQLLAHVVEAGLVERREDGDEVTYHDRAAAPAEPPRQAGGEGPAYAPAVAAEVPPPGLSLPVGTETLLLSLAGLPEPKRRALVAKAARVTALERELDGARAALRAEMATAETTDSGQAAGARKRWAGGDSVTTRALAVMAEGGDFTVPRLVKRLGEPAKAVANALNHACLAGKIERVERGVYRLKVAS
jgi:hypothetical protein